MNGFSTEEDSHDGPPAPPFYGQTCCLIEDGERCGRSAGNASFSKRIQKSISQKKLKLDIDKSVRHLYICDFHKNFIQSVRNKRKRKTSDDGGESPDHDVEVPEVDLFQLQVNTLRRYKRHYKLQTRPGLNKAQLAEILSSSVRLDGERRCTAIFRFLQRCSSPCSGWVTQGHSETCPEATPALSWLCA
ncbi:histone deacetylase complex subunit SAP30L-like isoform X1 [Salvelinus alpinus]|uniref:histone deacetylase complex subunit SAP30L-like isoform X1 n=1 Tax=Salvelinus alpinus TaxID=8036 RepID=UPI0039FBD37F